MKTLRALAAKLRLRSARRGPRGPVRTGRGGNRQVRWQSRDREVLAAAFEGGCGGVGAEVVV
eukprot:4497379-Alexandrium_andersonii.AAC.1